MPRKARLLARIRERTSDAPAARSLLLPAASFFRVEERSGAPLLIATCLALAWSNSPWSDAYASLWATELSLQLGGAVQSASLRHWVNDLLLPLFFFVIGMEVKQEVVRGQLASVERAALPTAAALGGVLAPAGLYAWIATGSEAARGWGIPVATDIAFALAILALLGRRVPVALKVLVLAFAALDDVLGVLIIALFYSSEISWLALGLAGVLLCATGGLRALMVRGTALFVLIGVAVWLCVLQSGVHATIAGVVLGLLAPTRPSVAPDAFTDRAEALVHELRGADENERDALLGELEERLEGLESTSERLAHLVNPWVSYAILPLFALANAGVEFSAESIGSLAESPAAWGVAGGLLVGKPLGILAFSWIAVALGLARLPEGVGWRHVIGMGLLGGIGFTVSLFIGELAFRGDRELLDSAKVAILLGSALAGAAGWVVLRTAPLEGAETERENASPTVGQGEDAR
jgi:NhaA family Na+:H+ antiporter